jgi:hypothetical protein
MSENKEPFEYQALPKELYDVWMGGNPSTRISSSMTTQETKTTHVMSTVVATTSSKEEGKTSSPAPSPQSSAAVSASTKLLNSDPQSEAASATPNTQPTDAGPNSLPPSNADPDGDSNPTHIHTTMHIHGTEIPTSGPLPSSLSIPKIAAISAASGLTFLALALGTTFCLLRRRRRARIVGAGEGRWDPSRGMCGSGGKMGDVREAKLPDIDIDAGKAVGIGVFEKDGAMIGLRGESGNTVGGG